MFVTCGLVAIASLLLKLPDAVGMVGLGLALMFDGSDRAFSCANAFESSAAEQRNRRLFVLDSRVDRRHRHHRH